MTANILEVLCNCGFSELVCVYCLNYEKNIIYGNMGGTEAHHVQWRKAGTGTQGLLDNKSGSFMIYVQLFLFTEIRMIEAVSHNVCGIGLWRLGWTGWGSPCIWRNDVGS